MRRASALRLSIWTYVLVMWFAMAAVLALLPACGDDYDPPDGDSDMDTDMGDTDMMDMDIIDMDTDLDTDA